MYAQSRVRFVCPYNGIEVTCKMARPERCPTPHVHQVEALARPYDPTPRCVTHDIKLVEADWLDGQVAA